MNLKARTILQAIAVHAPDGPIVEIGCARARDEVASDGYSTIYLAYTAAAAGRSFDSVDVDGSAVEIARELTASTSARVHHMDGATFLRRRAGQPIAVLYLDGALNPNETAEQYLAATLAPEALVLIDDAQPVQDLDHGKATGVTGALKEDGFTVTIRDTEPGYRMVVAWR